VSLLEALLERLFPPAAEPIRDLRDRLGERVTVRGCVVARDLVASPLSGERCVYYGYLVEEWRATPISMGGGGMWVIVERDEAICEFYVEDASGRALVIPERAAVEPGRGVRPLPVDVPAGQRGSELRIKHGDLVEIVGVAGEAADVLDGERGYREDATRAVVAAPAEDEGTLRIRLLAPSGS
jgi:hypothetical protein